MGYTGSGACRAAHEALNARLDAELRLMETMKRSLQAKMKSDREYALALSAAASQGQKMDKCEELSGKFSSTPVLRAKSLCSCGVSPSMILHQTQPLSRTGTYQVEESSCLANMLSKWHSHLTPQPINLYRAALYFA